MRRIIIALVSLTLLAVAGGCGSSTTNKAPDGGAEQSNFEPFRAKDLDGKPVNLADSVGRDVIFVSFWATYCEPCKAEMPFLQRFHDSYAKDGLTIVSVALDGPDTSAEVAPYIRKQGYTFPVVLDRRRGDIAQALNPLADRPVRGPRRPRRPRRARTIDRLPALRGRPPRGRAEVALLGAPQ